MSLADAAESWLAAHDEDLIAWRRHIHRYPELGRQEYATTQFVAERLADAGLNPKVMPGGTGLTCDIGPEDQPRIALRADMDALPMTELTGAPYASTMPNIAHARGPRIHGTQSPECMSQLRETHCRMIAGPQGNERIEGRR